MRGWPRAAPIWPAACAQVGRDPATLAITVGVIVRYPEARSAAGAGDAADAEEEAASPALTGTPDEIAAGLRAHAEDGTEAPTRASERGARARGPPFAEAGERGRGGGDGIEVLCPGGHPARSVARGSRSARGAGRRGRWPR